MVKITSKRISSRISKIKAPIKQIARRNKIKQYPIITRLSLKKQCLDCSMPFILKSSDSKRKYCVFCQMKRVGKLSNCMACGSEYLQFKTQDNSFCYSCTIGIKGGEKYNCRCCNKLYYTNPESKIDKTSCYDCYMKTNGIKTNCITCKSEYYVKKESLNWKIRCQKCFFHEK